MVMAEKADDNGDGICASATTFAREAECSRETVIRTWKELSDGPRPIISKAGKIPVRGGHVIVWKINLDRPRKISGVGDPVTHTSSLADESTTQSTKPRQASRVRSDAAQTVTPDSRDINLSLTIKFVDDKPKR